MAPLKNVELGNRSLLRTYFRKPGSKTPVHFPEHPEELIAAPMSVSVFSSRFDGIPEIINILSSDILNSRVPATNGAQKLFKINTGYPTIKEVLVGIMVYNDTLRMTDPKIKSGSGIPFFTLPTKLDSLHVEALKCYKTDRIKDWAEITTGVIGLGLICGGAGLLSGLTVLSGVALAVLFLFRQKYNKTGKERALEYIDKAKNFQDFLIASKENR